MRTTLTAVLLFHLATSVEAQFASEQNNNKGSAVRPANDAVTAMLRDLEEARDIVKKMPASRQRDRLELLLTRTELQLKQQAPGMNDNTGVRPKAMVQTEFFKFQTAFRKVSFDKDKYQFLENNLRGQYVTCEQAALLVKDFSFDTDRIRAAVLLYQQVTDPEAFYRVLDVFTFENSKKQVTERIRGK